MKIGLLGCGTIGTLCAREIENRFSKKARLIGIHDRNRAHALQVQRRLRTPVPIVPLDQLVARCDLLIEAASIEAAETILPIIITKKKPVLIMSTGALLSKQKLLKKAKRLEIPIYLPSGALGGLDAIKAGSIEKWRSITLTTRKPASTLVATPLRHPKVIFQGTAAQAVKAFPQSVNVSATLALVGIGPTRTRVRVIADPGIHNNIHEIEARGTCGNLFVRTENRPSRENPKTSRLAALSAVATLQQIFGSFHAGT